MRKFRKFFRKTCKITCNASDQLVIVWFFQFHYFPYSNYKIFEKYFVPFLFQRFLLVRISFRPIWRIHIDAKFLFWTIHNSLNKCKNYESRSHDFIFGLFVLWLERTADKPMNHSYNTSLCLFLDSRGFKLEYLKSKISIPGIFGHKLTWKFIFMHFHSFLLVN